MVNMIGVKNCENAVQSTVMGDIMINADNILYIWHMQFEIYERSTRILMRDGLMIDTSETPENLYERINIKE